MLCKFLLTQRNEVLNPPDNSKTPAFPLQGLNTVTRLRMWPPGKAVDVGWQAAVGAKFYRGGPLANTK